MRKLFNRRLLATLALTAAAIASICGTGFAQHPSTMGASGDTLDATQIESFLVQSRNALPSAAVGPPQNGDDPIVWRRHDWAGRADVSGRPGGYQASDSVEDDLPRGRVYVQTFDFGDASRKFERFDLGQGDGGQALALVDGSVYGAMTEDGGNGVQWFVGEGCRSPSDAEGALKGWLFFDDGVTRNTWRDRVAHLNIERRAASCPWLFNDAYTRWRRLDVHFPYRIDAAGSQTREGTWSVDTVLSEHYGGSSIQNAEHLERFWFGRGYGLLRWERWENGDRSSRRDSDDAAQTFAQSRRCGPVEGSAAPGPHWAMVDCRTWTNFVKLEQPWKVSAFNWPRRDVLDQFEQIFARH